MQTRLITMIEAPTAALARLWLVVPTTMVEHLAHMASRVGVDVSAQA